jgi:uncharacterized oligopeptide transporter (OPT) family protein
MLGGSILAWGVLAPALVRGGIAQADYVSLVSWLLWPGVALMVTAGLVGLAARWRTFAGTAWRAVTSVGRLASATHAEPRWLWGGLALLGAAVVCLSWVIFGVHPLLGLVSLLISLVLIDVCVRTAGETDIAPLGALGQLMQLLLGLVAPGPAPANVACASMTSGGAAQASLTVNVLKAGRLLGASSGAQLQAQALGALVGVLVALPAYALFKSVHRLGDAVLPAPGALGWKALATLAETGTAAMPRWTVVACGSAAAAGVALALLERTRWARFVPSPIALGVAFLVPATTGFTIAVGSLSLLVVRRHSASAEPLASSMAAGAIAGEAMMGLVIALLLATRILG